MSTKSLYYVRHMIGRAESMLTSLKSIEKEFVEKEGQVAYQKVKAHCGNLVDKLKAEAKSLPIGFRYKGTFYIRKAYTTPIAFEKVKGCSAFQREDLISWQIEGAYEQGQCYYRNVFKAPDLNSEITRADAEPVFLKEKQNA